MDMVNKIFEIAKKIFVNDTTVGDRNGYLKIWKIMIQWGKTASVTLTATSGEYDYVNTTVIFNPAFSVAPYIWATASVPSTPGVSTTEGTAATTTSVLLQASI